jgi:hypothetical protein
VIATDGEQHTIRRTTTQPVRSTKAYRPRTTTHVSQIHRQATAGIETSSNSWD